MSTTTTRTAPETRLRAVTAVLGVLKSYGGETPEPLREAQALIREARMIAAESITPDPIAYAREVLTAEDPRKALAAAAKRRAADRDRAEIASALHEAAIERAVRTLTEHLDEIGDAILASPVLAEAFEEIERNVAKVPASALLTPREDALDHLAEVALLRRASAVFERVIVSLTASGITSEREGGVSGLLYADPTGADPLAVSRALRGVRPGVPDVSVWTSSATHAAHAAPFAAPGVPAAILTNGTPGVVLRLATTVEEFERRVAFLSSAPDVPVTVDETSGWAV